MEPRLDTPITVFDMGTMEWRTFWYKGTYRNYMKQWEQQQANQVRRSAYVR